MKLVLLRVGKGRNRWAEQATQEYAKRLARGLPFEEKLLKPAAFKGDVDAVREAEGERILRFLKPADRLVVLDERGENITTERFRDWVAASQNAGTQRMVFAIGGPYGHDPRVRQRAWKVLALSPMVLNHELARIVLVEQLYRVSTLLYGGSYHH